MPKSHRWAKGLPKLILLLALLLGNSADAAGSRQDAMEAHIAAIEASAALPADHLETHFSARMSPAFLQRHEPSQRTELYRRIQQAVADAGAIMLSERAAGTLMELHGQQRWELLIALQPQPPYAIEDLKLRAGESLPKVSLQPDPDASLNKLSADSGFAGVVGIYNDGKPMLERGYGAAHPALGTRNRVDTIFGIGSTPIDFTTASILILAQEGGLSLDDRIDRHLPSVPADKSSITVAQLLNGQSGLPDFFHNEGDWDADLAWVNREEALRRMLHTPLRFAPGTDEAHSHAAFGLLAVLIEEVSGMSYCQFLRERILGPAGMGRTGFYGEHGTFTLEDFAVGAGPSEVGLPNIPPNWGPTSWLVMGSGGMYSTLADMRAFYRYMRSGVLEQPWATHYRQPAIGIGGSDRGYYYFHVFDGKGREAIMLSNGNGHGALLQSLSEALRQLVEQRD